MHAIRALSSLLCFQDRIQIYLRFVLQPETILRKSSNHTRSSKVVLRFWLSIQQFFFEIFRFF